MASAPLFVTSALHDLHFSCYVADRNRRIEILHFYCSKRDHYDYTDNDL